ncbi:T9SS type A sorting domain-containing protein [Ekhidna sp. To15]|uniref:T9SS type A sorting domain-containing protein n=1 Tax=Ekhidna sp. To15 TaxID=3395267 RepID=UPI003F51B3F7
MRKILFLISFVILFESKSQECGTVVTQESLDFMEQFASTRSSADFTTLAATDVVIPIKFHTIVTTSGDGGLTETQLNGIITKLNNLYSSANIEFEHQGEVNVIVDDNNYDLNSANEGAVASGNDIQGVINVYFSGSLSSGASSLCGYTRFPPSSDRVFTTYGCTLNGTTLEHELGHYFTLFHTHGKTNTGTTDELVDGSNCLTAGDNVCDTPADPNLSGMVDGSCTYLGSAKDANGDTYVPDPSNIMAYSVDACQDYFSPEQFDRVREGFENGRFYLKFTTENFSAKYTADNPSTCIGSQIAFDGDAFGAVSYEWTFEGGTPSSSSDEDPVITYNESGIFSVSLTVTNSQNEISTLERSTFVNITDPLVNTLSESYSTPVNDGIPSDFSIENPDRALSFDFRSDVDVDEDANSGSFWLNNFDYQTDLNRNEDFLILRNYNTDGIREFTISFDLAYTYLAQDDAPAEPIPARYDTLELLLASQCGSKQIDIWREGGEELSTAEPILNAFVPATTDWERKTIKYEVPEELEFARIAFKNISRNGNNIFLDNITITPDFTVGNPIDFRLSKVENKVATIRWFDGSTNETAYVLERAVSGGEFEEYKRLDRNVIFFRDTLTEANTYRYRLYADGISGNRSSYTDEIEVLSSQILSVDNQSRFDIYPNPASHNLVVKMKGNVQEVNYSISDLLGRVVMKGNFSQSKNTINISNLTNGIYLLGIDFDGKKEVRRIIKND